MVSVNNFAQREEALEFQNWIWSSALDANTAASKLCWKSLSLTHLTAAAAVATGGSAVSVVVMPDDAGWESDTRLRDAAWREDAED